MPLNWSAYEDIAEFFSVDVKTIDGKPIYGHMDYGKKDPSLGWRFTDAWLSMAGTADIGIPNGMPVDEWGIRVGDDKCTPVGASVSRGGATNSPAAVYALTKYIDWMSDSRIGVRPTMVFFSDVLLAVMNCAYSQAAAVLFSSCAAKNVHEPTSW